MKPRYTSSIRAELTNVAIKMFDQHCSTLHTTPPWPTMSPGQKNPMTGCSRSSKTCSLDNTYTKVSISSWNLQQAAKSNYRLFLEILHVASNNAGLYNCDGARLAHGTTDLQRLPHYDTSVIWHWNPHDDTASCYIHYDPNHPLHVQQFTEQTPHNLYLVQFLLVNDKDARDITKQFPHVPNLGGRHTKKPRRKRKRLFHQQTSTGRLTCT